MSEAQAAPEVSRTQVLTSENAAEFYAQKLGLAANEAPSEADVEATPSEPVNAEGESGSEDADKEATPTEERKQNPKLEKRFSELTKRRAEAEAKAESEAQRARELEDRLRQYEQQSAPRQQADAVSEKPQPTQFNDAFEYAEALSEWSAEKAIADMKKAEAEARIQAQQAEQMKAWSKRIESVKAELPDFDDMVQSSEVIVSDEIKAALYESDVGPKIMYHLAENPELAEKLNQMSPIGALREFGKLEARFEAKAESQPESKPVVAKSKAPAPINPLRSNSSAADSPIDSNGEFHGTYAQWKAARQAKRIR